MKLSKKEKIQECISELQFIARTLAVKGIYENVDVLKVAIRLTSILEKTEEY